jgi:serine/threonine protein kinase
VGKIGIGEGDSDMTTTPGWKREESGNTPLRLPPAQPGQLSDFDETQASMRQNAAGPPPPPRDTHSPETPLARTLLNSNSADDSLVGTIFAGRYEVLEMLGRGGMGAVYKARNRINKNLRALKLMHAHLVADPQVFRRFQQEATAAARINHPNAITIIDMGMAEDGRPYLIMDYLDGMSLSQLLKYKRKLRIKEAVRIFLQMCGALAEAHSHGVIHRDIKPSNVMLLDGPDGEYIVKVVDFGIAKVFPQEGDPTMKDTTTGELFGSPPYMSPEQCLGKRLDYRSDIYSMGCLMYEVLTGAPPLVGQNALGTMYRQINEMPTPLSDIEDDVRLIQRLDEIISKTLQKNPDARYQTIQELQADLESAGEYSAKKIQAFSVVGLQLQTMQRALWNSMGSGKKTVLVVLLSCLVLCVAGVALVAPYLLSFDPTKDERKIAWQPLPTVHSQSSNYLSLIRHEGVSVTDNQGRQNLLDVVTNVMRSDNPEKFKELKDVISQLIAGTMEFVEADPESNTKASVEPSPGANTESSADPRRQPNSGSNEKSNVESSTETRKSLEAINTVLLYMAGLKEAKFTGSAHEGLLVTAQKLRAFIDAKKIQAPFVSSCLDAVVGLQALKTKDTSVNVDEQFAKAVNGWDKVVIPQSSAEIVAPLMSSIGDYYAEQGSYPMAMKTFAIAQKTWDLAGARGHNNAGIAWDRLGRMQMLANKKADAIVSFRQACRTLSGAAGDTLDCARVLFDQADAEWASQDCNWITTKMAAMEQWSLKKPKS